MTPWIRTGALVALLLPLGLMAAERNDIPDCYQYAGLSALRPGAPQRELMVVVDETTPLTLDLKKDALAHVLRFVQPGIGSASTGFRPIYQTPTCNWSLPGSCRPDLQRSSARILAPTH